MKFSIAVASLFLTAAGAGGALAQDVSLTLSGPGITDIAGVPTFTLGSLPGTATFNGTLTNNSTTATYTFDGASITPVPLPAGVTESDQVNTNLNTYTLAPGASTTISDAFDLSVPTGTGSFGGYFSFSDSSANPASGDGVGVSKYAVVTASVPEPGTMALMAGSMLSGGMLLRRRRK